MEHDFNATDSNYTNYSTKNLTISFNSTTTQFNGSFPINYTTPEIATSNTTENHTIEMTSKPFQSTVAATTAPPACIVAVEKTKILTGTVPLQTNSNCYAAYVSNFDPLVNHSIPFKCSVRDNQQPKQNFFIFVYKIVSDCGPIHLTV